MQYNLSMTTKTITPKSSRLISHSSPDPGNYVGVQSGYKLVIPGPGGTVRVGPMGFGYEFEFLAYELELPTGIRGTATVAVTVLENGTITLADHPSLTEAQ